MFWKKESLKIKLGNVGIIDSTENAKDNGINDKYNKVITLYESIGVNGDKVKYGKEIKQIPYTEEEVINLKKIKQIPIAIRKMRNKFNFDELTTFGEVIN